MKLFLNLQIMTEERSESLLFQQMCSNFHTILAYTYYNDPKKVTISISYYLYIYMQTFI